MPTCICIEMQPDQIRVEHVHAHAHQHAGVGKAPRHDVMGSVSKCMGIVEKEVSHGHGMNWIR